MAAQGAKVVVSSRKAEACEEVAEAIRRAKGQAVVIPCNISRKEEVRGAGERRGQGMGPRSTRWCATPPVNPYFGPLAGIGDDAFDKIMAANVKSNLWLCNMAIPGDGEDGRRQRGDRLSIAGLRGNAMLGAYGISKAADFGLTRNLAVEWGAKGVRVNCIAPGLVKTDFARALWEDEKRLKARLETTPLRRIGEPDDIGGIAAFLASRAAAFMTGEIIVADGGVTIG